MLTEKDLRILIKEIVTECLNEERNKMLLNEMSFNRNIFKDKIGNLTQQLLENWCLIHYVTLTGEMSELQSHWKSELKGHLLSIMRFKIKPKDNPDTRLKAIKEVWAEFEYFDPINVDITIRYKFEEENIATINNEQYNQVITDCIEYGNHDLIEIIANRNPDSVYEFVNTI